MYYIWLILGVVCLGYYLRCGTYAGFGSSFIWIWLVGMTFFIVLFGLRYLAEHDIFHLPKWIGITLLTIIAIGACWFVFLEGCIVAGMHVKPAADTEYLIVLGCQVRGTRITRSLRTRLDVAFEYADANPQTKIIVSGGQGNGEDISEAQAMFDYLCEKGIAKERIIMENQSHDTDENIAFSKKYLPSESTSVAIVTNNFHLFRGMKLAKSAGLTKVTGIASASDPILFINYMVRESIGITKDLVYGNMRF